MENEVMDVEAQKEKKQDANGSFSIFKQANHPVILKFENVVCKIKLEKTKGWCQSVSQTEEKIILNGVTGIVKPGEMLAILGPSGSGKTTLLTALGGRFRNGKLTGNITYNNKPFSKGMKRKTGFVTQDDVLYPHLTVTETLVFTALLRLPNSMTRQEKINQAEAVVFQLGLTGCKNSIIGGPFLRGVSGGERKRVSIGQEMLINPSLLFLDEPTSGLDSTTALRIVSTLWGLAHGGRTVVMTIHQPSSRLFYTFDKILLVAQGYPLYFGVGSNAMDYFASTGYSPSMAMNPSDYLLDIANGVAPEESQGKPEGLKETLIDAYKTILETKLKAEVRETDGFKFDDMSPEDKIFGSWPTTWWQQFIVLLKRGIKERRHESFSVFNIAQVLIISVVVGLLWWQSNISHLRDQVGLLNFTFEFWSFIAVARAIFTFPQERMMLEKERSSGMYRLSSYFMSTVVGDLPLELVLPTAYLIITYWMAGLKATALNFFFTLLVLLLNVLVYSGLGLAIGSVIMDEKAATTLGNIITLGFLWTGGYYVQHIPAFISWIRYISIGHHVYKLFLLAQYKANQTFPCGDDGEVCYVRDYEGIKKIGLDGQAMSIMALAVMFFGYRLIAYIALMRIGKAKKQK